MESVFSRHGIHHAVISDNEPQYASVEIKQSTSTMDSTMLHPAHSYYPQNNGLAEHKVSVKTTKSTTYTSVHHRNVLNS